MFSSQLTNGINIKHPPLPNKAIDSNNRLEVSLLIQPFRMVKSLRNPNIKAEIPVDIEFLKRNYIFHITISHKLKCNHSHNAI